jgi:N-acyl-D-amino-acid deacylase
MIRKYLGIVFIASLVLHVSVRAQNGKPTLITNVQLIDGTGSAQTKAAVRIKGDQITQVGNLKAVKGENIIDGKGMVLAPGFIDAHSHHLGDLQRNPNGLSTSNQGITTIVIGQDGEGYPMDSLAKDMRQKPIVANAIQGIQA